MKHIALIFLALLVCCSSVAQKKKTAARTKARTTQTTKKTTTRKQKKSVEYTNASIRGLKNERAGVQKKLREQERLLRQNKADVKKRLNNLIAINTEIGQRQKSIEGIQNDITHIESNIDMLQNQLSTLEEQLQERKQKYIKSMRYMAVNRTVQDKLMFIFSARNLAQMYRRLRFVREYAAWQRSQGELVKAKQEQIVAKHRQLESVRGQKNDLLQGEKGADRVAKQTDRTAESG